MSGDDSERGKNEGESTAEEFDRLPSHHVLRDKKAKAARKEILRKMKEERRRDMTDEEKEVLRVAHSDMLEPEKDPTKRVYTPRDNGSAPPTPVQSDVVRDAEVVDIDDSLIENFVVAPPRPQSMMTLPSIDPKLEAATQQMADTVFEGLPELFRKEDVREMVEWMAGVRVEKPVILERFLSNVAARLSWAMSYMVVDMLVRAQNMSLFMRRCEKTLFDPDSVPVTDMTMLMELYKEAVKAQTANLEFIRKFATENKDLLTNLSTDTDALLKVLQQLSPETLRRLKSQLAAGSV